MTEHHGLARRRRERLVGTVGGAAGVLGDQLIVVCRIGRQSVDVGVDAYGGSPDRLADAATSALPAPALVEGVFEP